MICAARQRDAYDIAVEYLAEHPEAIYETWQTPTMHRYGCLFRYATRDRATMVTGCLTMIRRTHIYAAETEELTARIRADERIPANEKEITPDHLPVFAEWQRELDRVLGRTPPAIEVEATA